jgi:hypothetical protein
MLELELDAAFVVGSIDNEVVVVVQVGVWIGLITLSLRTVSLLHQTG